LPPDAGLQYHCAACNLIDAMQHVISEPQACSGDGIVDMLSVAGPDNRHLHRGVCQGPCHCEAADRSAELGVRELLERSHRAQVVDERVTLEVGAVGAPVVR